MKNEDQHWFWTPQWLTGELEASADVLGGRVQFETESDFLSWLEN